MFEIHRYAVWTWFGVTQRPSCARKERPIIECGRTGLAAPKFQEKRARIFRPLPGVQGRQHDSISIAAVKVNKLLQRTQQYHMTVR